LQSPFEGNLNICIEEEVLVNDETGFSTTYDSYEFYGDGYVYDPQYLVLSISSSKNVWLKGIKISPFSVKTITFDGKACALENIGKKQGIARLDTPYMMEAGERYAFRTMHSNSQISISCTAGEGGERCRVVYKWNDFEFSLGKPTTQSPLQFNQLIFSIFDATPIDDDDFDSEARCLDITAVPVPSETNEAI